MPNKASFVTESGGVRRVPASDRGRFNWLQVVFIIIAAAILAMLMWLPLMPMPEPSGKAELDEPLEQILGKAFRDPGYTLIVLGFFSCGYRPEFITAPNPAFMTEYCGPIVVGSRLQNMG